MGNVLFSGNAPGIICIIYDLRVCFYILTADRVAAMISEIPSG